MSSHLRNRRLPTPHHKDALEHLATIDLLELCNEAKIELCRATRDLSSCGRCVQDILSSCGHASLCAECSMRCDVCPICRTSLPAIGTRLHPRLYYECVNAGLISNADRFQEVDSKDHFMAIQRLYSLFDVALDNNLVSLICHYFLDVCMDEKAVSSDPVVAFLLDEVVVKDWCKQRFKGIIEDLRRAYCRDLKELKSDLYKFQKTASRLAGIINVLEIMVSAFKDDISAQLNDLHFLLDSTLKTKQHLEIMIWCMQHDFLENITPRHSNHGSWAGQVHERKLMAVKRSWPDSSRYLAYFGDRPEPALFIEQALFNLEIEECHGEEPDEIDIFCLQGTNSSIVFSSKILESYTNHSSECYPFKHPRVAIDIIFLHGAADMVVAKRAIFLYYLFDRHWTLPDANWRYLVDDFASSFGIGRLSLLESFLFYLLDDYTDQALQEACTLLPKITCLDTHPKVAQVLLERQCPDAALSVLRCTGHNGSTSYINYENGNKNMVPLDEAMTTLRVKIECGHLTEAFMYQRVFFHNLKECGPDSWLQHLEVIVTEMCLLCIRRNLLDRMIELPWDSVEEKSIHKCLIEHAYQNPSSFCGSLLTVFYLQRYRYIEAWHAHCEILSLEQSCLDNLNKDLACQMKSISIWRSSLVDKGFALLPQAQWKQVMAGSTAKIDQIELDSASEAYLNPYNDSNSYLKPPSLILDSDQNKFPLKKISPVVQQKALMSFNGPLVGGSIAMPLKELNISPLRSQPLFSRSIKGNNALHSMRFSDSGSLFENSIKCHGISAKQNHLEGHWSMINSEESNQILSFERQNTPTEQSVMKVGSRWRSDESSEDEADQVNDKHLGSRSFFPLNERSRRVRR